MPQFPWVKHSSLWVGRLDEEHTQLLKLVGNVVSAIRADDHEAAARNASLFVEAINAHFSHEEWLMQEFAYSKATEHIARHRAAHAEALKLAQAVTDSREGTVISLAKQILANFRNVLFPDDVGLITHIERLKGTG